MNITARIAPFRRGRVVLNLFAVLVVSIGLLYSRPDRPGLLFIIVSAIALAAWAGWALTLVGRFRDSLLIVSALFGAAAVADTNALLISAVIASVISFTATANRSSRATAALVVAVAVAMTASVIAGGRDGSFLLAVFGGLVLAVLVGVNRRQNRAAEARERTLLARSLEVERESERARLLADRTAVARDIHDVLAHSLGGLVIQLDAVEALLEAGRSAEAAERVSQAHRLAADGLADARRAVAALRDDPSAPASRIAALPSTVVTDLVSTHRSLGFDVETTGDLDLVGVSPGHRVALGRVVQEALNNARRHAPAATARVSVTRTSGSFIVSIATALPTPVSTPSTGFGLIGMRERFRELDDGSTVSAGPIGGDFVVEAAVPLAEPSVRSAE